MAAITKQLVINATPEQCYRVMANHQQYPSFLPQVQQVQVLRREEGFSLVEYEFFCLLRIKCKLRIIEEAPLSLRWSLEESNVLTLNNGSWQFADNGDGTTLATYNLDCKFKGALPPAVVEQLRGKIVPEVLELCKKQIENGN